MLCTLTVQIPFNLKQHQLLKAKDKVQRAKKFTCSVRATPQLPELSMLVPNLPVTVAELEPELELQLEHSPVSTEALIANLSKLVARVSKQST